MKLGLIQTKHNELYDFLNPELILSKEQVVKGKEEMEEQVLALLLEACDMGCDFLVTSEAVNFCGAPGSITCGYEEIVTDLEDAFFHKVSAIARERQVYIALGAYNRREGSMYNSVLVYDREGKLSCLYDKIHLAGSENEKLTSGGEYVVMDTEFGKIGIAVCFDMQFPECCRELVLREADLIICPTWGWEAIYGHARAYENGVYVASAMSVPFWGDIDGIRTPSEVISPLGEVLARGSAKKAEVVTCNLDIRDCKEHREFRLSCRRPKTYTKVGDVN